MHQVGSVPAKKRRPELGEDQGRFKFPILLPSGNTGAGMGLGGGGTGPGTRGVLLP